MCVCVHKKKNKLFKCADRTEEWQDKTYYRFLESLELGKGLTYDITLLGDLAKHEHVYFVDYDMVRAKDITADADAKHRK